MAIERSRPTWWWLALAAVAVFTVIVGQVESRGVLLRRITSFQVLYIVAYGGYLLLLWSRVFNRGIRHSRETVVLVAAALAFRLLIFTGPASDDVCRHLWEGRLGQAGLNPYERAPSDRPLSNQWDEDASPIPQRDKTAIESPLSELLFSLVAAVYPSIGAMKLTVLIWDLLTTVALLPWLWSAGKSEAWVLVYGVCPLTLMSFAMDGRADAMMITWLVLAGWASMRGQWYLCGVCVGLAVLSKSSAVVLLLWLLGRHPRSALLALTVVLLGYLPYASAGPGLLNSIVGFEAEAFFNSLVPACLSMLVGPAPASLICVMTLLIYATLCAGQRLEMHQFGVRVFGMMIVMLPVVRYWYLGWVLIFLAFDFRWRWVVLVGSMVFYFDAWDQMADTGTESLPTLSYLLIWLPFVAAWIIEEVARKALTRNASGNVIRR